MTIMNHFHQSNLATDAYFFLLLGNTKCTARARSDAMLANASSGVVTNILAKAKIFFESHGGQWKQLFIIDE